jgi:hypothetical protein
MNTCQSANEFVNPDSPRGVNLFAKRRRLESIDPDVKQRIIEHLETRDDRSSNTLRRKLIAGEELGTDDFFAPEQPRLEGNVFSEVQTCEETCMTWPRPIDPNGYASVEGFRPIFAQPADTFWCRNRQLTLANGGDFGFGATTSYDAQVHCPRAGPDGDGYCFNVFINASLPYASVADVDFAFPGEGVASPYEFLRAGTNTGRHLGFCRMYYDDQVADCTSAGIDDRSLPLALSMIPGTVRVLILSNNVGKEFVGRGITILPNGIFGNLLFPGMIQALFIDDGNIATIEPDAFEFLYNVEVISLNNQQFDSTSLNEFTFSRNLLLRDISIVRNDGQSDIDTLDPLLFRKNAFLQRVVISGHPKLSSLSNAFFDSDVEEQFKLFSEMTVLDLSNNGFVSSGLDPLMFESMAFLRILDLSGNQLTTVRKDWFDSIHPQFLLPWSNFGLYKVFFHDNPIDLIADFAFDNIFFLEQVTFHDTFVLTVPVNLFEESFALISYTLSTIAT